MRELSGEDAKWTFAQLPSCVIDTAGRAPRRFMLWLESVIGTAFWCWWQVPARRFERRVGALRTGLALERLAQLADVVAKTLGISMPQGGVPDLPSPRLRAAAAGRRSPLRLSGPSPEDAPSERGCETHTINPLRSQA